MTSTNDVHIVSFPWHGRSVSFRSFVAQGALLAAIGLTAACGSDSTAAGSATGGTKTSGGAAASSTGGTSLGGTVATGTTATGGTTSTGGTIATGGTTSTGGAATGGTTSTGGTIATGGIPATGTTAAGGAFASGGIAATGGAATGGVSAVGGATATGGVSSTTTSGIADASTFTEWVHIFEKSPSEDRIYVITPDLDDSAIVHGVVGADAEFLGRAFPNNGFQMHISEEGALGFSETGITHYATDAVVLSDGSFMVTGYVQGSTVTFSAGDPNETTWTGLGQDPPPFLARYNSDGTPKWVSKGAMLSGQRFSFDQLALCPDGTLLVGGSFTWTLQIRPGTSSESSVTSQGAADGLLARYDTDGNLIWLTTFGGTDVEPMTTLICLSDGSPVIFGGFGATSVFGRGEANETSLVSPSGYDMYLARFLPNGRLDWAQSYASGATSPNPYTKLAALPDDSMYLAGQFSGTLTLGTGGPSATMPTGTSAGYLARLEGDGTAIWMRPMSGVPSAYARFLTVLPNQDAVIAGAFRGSGLTFAGGTAAPRGMNSVTSDFVDVFLARYTPSGDLVNTLQIGSDYYDYPTALAASGDGVILTLPDWSIRANPRTGPHVRRLGR
jgi:hypothetical protein